MIQGVSDVLHNLWPSKRNEPSEYIEGFKKQTTLNNFLYYELILSNSILILCLKNIALGITTEYIF